MNIQSYGAEGVVVGDAEGGAEGDEEGEDTV